MSYGRTIPKGYLPAFSVDTEEEAQRLLTETCPTNRNGQFVAPELVEEQTLEHLYEFGRRLERRYNQWKEKQ